MSRLFKQLLYGGVFLALVFGAAFWLFRQAVPGPTCTDGIQNGKEEGLDCGVACGKLCAVPVRALENRGVTLIRYSNGSVDALAHLENPNGTYGASRVDYALVVNDASGKELAQRTGRTYVNPAQPRYLVFPLLGLTGQPASAALQFTPSDVQWSALSIDQAGAVQFPVRSEQLAPSASGLTYQATATNQSSFDFDQVDVTVLLYDSSGTVVGAGSTILKTVTAGEVRAFSVQWPFSVANAVRAQAMVSTNVFDNANFIRAYGSPEQFQGY